MFGKKTGKAIYLSTIFALAGAVGFPYQDRAGAKETLETATNLHDIQIRDERAWFDCGKGDLFKTKFAAKNDKGQEVDGVVCKGLLKGSTIRYENDPM